jgi:Bacteriocin-protection, YdeI or OmpD-Associated/Domain of unknown function (DUF1905)
MATKKTSGKKKAVKAKSSKKKKKSSDDNASISFEAVLEKRDKIGGGHFVQVPKYVSDFFGAKGRTRVLGIMNGVAIDRALIPNGDGGHEIIIGTDVRKKTKVKEGMKIAFEIYRNPEPDAVEIPEELLAALELEPEAQRKFEKFTPGMKRNMAYWVNSGKQTETRIKRSLEILRRILAGEIFGGRKTE